MHLHVLLADHCGPVLLNKKPATLFPLKINLSEFYSVKQLLKSIGLQVDIFRDTENNMLLFVYRENLLRQCLDNPLIIKSLSKLNYPKSYNLKTTLTFLKNRFHESNNFPHEIGFFLGYPPLDVLGFMYYKGQCMKHSCMWKVYSNVKKAKALCNEFTQCRCLCRKYVESGGKFINIPTHVNIIQ
ncbi:MAG: DUF3793 family protein [Filifactoraceae bacterium]